MHKAQIRVRTASEIKSQLRLEANIHSLGKAQIKRKPESSRRTRESTSQTLDLNDNNLSNTKQLESAPKNKEKLYHVFGSEKHEIKDCESKRNVYIIDLKKPQGI